MHIEKVSYQRTFNLGNFNSERIGVDFILHQGEDEAKALDNAKKIVEETHKRFNPQIETTQPLIEQSLSKHEISVNNVAEINRSENLRELLKCKILSLQGRDEFNAYQHKLKQFNQ